MKRNANGLWSIWAVLMLCAGLSWSMAWGAEDASKSKVLEEPVPRLVVQTGHTGNVNSVAFSPDGKTLVSGSEDYTIRLWDVASGRELRALDGHTGNVNSVAFSPDGKTLVSGSEDHTVRLWDVASGRELRRLDGHTGNVSSVAFSPDGMTLASGSKDNTVKLWGMVTGKELRTLNGHTGNVRSVAFSPDGKILVSGSWDKTVKLWNVATGKELRAMGEAASLVTSVAFSPDGKILASDGGDYTIKLWDMATGKELRRLGGHPEGVMSVAFSPDGKTLVSGGWDKTVKLWDVATGKELRTLNGHTNWVTSVAFSRDGKTLASGSSDKTIRLWNMANGWELRTLGGHASYVQSVAFSPDGKTLAPGGGDNTLKLWDMASGQELRRLGGHQKGVRSVAFSSNGKMLLSGSWDNTLKLWDVISGRELRTLEGHSASVESVAFSPDGETLASGSLDNTVKLWDMVTGKELRTLSGHTDWVLSIAFSPNGKTLVSGSRDKTIKLWGVANGRELRTGGHTSWINSVTFSPDGKTLVSGSKDETIKLWDVASGRELRTLVGHAGNVNSVAFSPDGKTLVSGSDDKTVKLWDVSSGRELKTLVGHTGDVRSVVFSPDGKTVVSGSADSTLKFWRVADGTLMATLASFDDGHWAVTDPEGRFDTSDLEDMPYLHWVMPDAPLTPVPLEAFMKDYYEPRLLSRILNGEKFKPVRSLMNVNRVQPEVRIIKVTPDDKDPERALVEVEVTGAKKDYERDGKKTPKTTAAHDLRLFRDGQLVGYVDGQIAKQGEQPYRKTFSVHLPSAMGGKDITFSTYAFNDDRVKSLTSRQTYRVPATVTARKGNAYLIHMGVNRFDNPAWNLRFAANDARLMRQSLSAKLQKTGAYQNIVPVSLISDETEHHADKALLHAILDRLAGKPASPLLKDLKDAEQIQPATPDDLVLITFAGHGYADGSGNFYLLTQDTGKGNGKQVDEDLLRRSISSEELSQWLKDVDAGDMTLIVDACQSAASVQGKDFKPGPMGSRGLGQLSFDKGMRILAASQADEYALENDRLKQGLLSFALVTNGIEGFEADHEPQDRKIMLDEWLHYGVSRVPTLAEEVKTGKVKVASRGSDRGAVRVSATGSGKPRPAQQPALFDFARKRRQVEVAGQ